MKVNFTPTLRALTTSASALCLMAGAALADQVFADDVIVQGSLCVGIDCASGEAFGFDTIRLKENNTRIKFEDTSASGGFPSNDWQLTANDSANGGANKFSIDDVTGSKTPFTIEAAARSNALYVDSSGYVGLGTSNPVVSLQIVKGDTPTIRLEQDGTSGFTAQTWDVAGNETNFFVRDVSNGSQLPFRIRTGAPKNSIYVQNNGRVGMGTEAPSASLHVKGSAGTTQVIIEEASSTATPRELLLIKNNGQVGMVLEDASVTAGNNTGNQWKIQNIGCEMRFTTAPGGPGEVELALDVDGNLSVSGSITSNGTALNVPDYVFAADYKLAPLYEVRDFILANSHLPDVPSAAEINTNGINLSEMQMTLLRKVEELTLYTLEQDEMIKSLNTRLDELKG